MSAVIQNGLNLRAEAFKYLFYRNALSLTWLTKLSLRSLVSVAIVEVAKTSLPILLEDETDRYKDYFLIVVAQQDSSATSIFSEIFNHLKKITAILITMIYPKCIVFLRRGASG
ncbi:hypothetical protein ACVWYG_002089 [Pedobacter sp. UYEF25]